MIKLRIMYAGLFMVALLWLIIIAQQGFSDAVALVEPIFYQPLPTIEIIVPRPTPQATINHLFGKQAPIAYAIFMAESHLRADAISSTGDIGCTQINHKAHPQYAISDLLDCNYSIRVAYAIYHQQGNFTAWSTYKNGAYKKYLTN